MASDYGESSGDPVAEAQLVAGQVTDHAGREIWHLHGTQDGAPYDQRLTRGRDGCLHVRTLSGGVTVDPGSAVITVDASSDGLAKQLVATYGIPLLLHQRPVVLLHAAAAVPPQGTAATLVCGPSGSGKSSLLVAMVEAGWSAVSEDVCVIDRRSGRALVWPGPPWVRTSNAGPSGAQVLYRSADKRAWDLRGRQRRAPVPVDRAVFLAPPGGTHPSRTDLGLAATIARLGARTMWLLEPDGRGRAAFGHLVGLARAIEGTDLRLPVSQAWTADALATLAPRSVRRNLDPRKPQRRSEAMSNGRGKA